MVNVPVLLIVTPPGLLQALLRRPAPDSVRLPALLMVLVPGSISSSALKVAFAPLSMASVRPAQTVLLPVPLAARLAPVLSVTAPPPVHVPPLQVLAPASVKLPVPASVPPVWE